MKIEGKNPVKEAINSGITINKLMVQNDLKDSLSNEIIAIAKQKRIRIDFVKKVVESIMKNTIQPDRLYLNLSKTEFDGIELPKDLVDYFQSDERLIINWVEGENTKSMKKIFPILHL